MITAAPNPKVSVTKLVRIDLDAKTCIRYSGREGTHGFLFDTEKKITPEVVNAILAEPESVEVHKEAA